MYMLNNLRPDELYIKRRLSSQLRERILRAKLDFKSSKQNLNLYEYWVFQIMSSLKLFFVVRQGDKTRYLSSITFL